MIRQIITPIYMLIQAIFIFVQYKLVNVALGSNGLNLLVLVLSLAIPYQLLSLGLGGYVYSLGNTSIGCKVNLAALKLIFVSSLCGLPYIYIFAHLFWKMSILNAFIACLFLLTSNLLNFIFFCYDAGGKSYLRSVIGIGFTLLVLIFSYTVGNVYEIISPVFWIFINAVLTLIVTYYFLLASKNMFETHQDTISMHNLFILGIRFNIMTAPSLSFDFLIKIVIVNIAPSTLIHFDLLNKILQQGSSLIAMTNQALAQKVKFASSNSIALFSLSSGVIFLMFSSCTLIILPLIYRFIGIKITNDSNLLFFALMFGWLCNTISATSYYNNIFKDDIKRNIYGNISIMISLLVIGVIFMRTNVHIYLAWPIALFFGAVVTVSIKNWKIYFLESGLVSLGFASLVVILMFLLVSINSQYFIAGTAMFSTLLFIYTIYIVKKGGGKKYAM